MILFIGFFGFICLVMVVGAITDGSSSTPSAQEMDPPAQAEEYLTPQQRAEAQKMVDLMVQIAEENKEKERLQKAEEAKEAAEKAAKDADADERAIMALNRRIESGSIAAKYSLAVRYLEGNGVEANRAKGLQMLKECAEADHTMSKKRLGEELSSLPVSGDTKGASDVAAGGPDR